MDDSDLTLGERALVALTGFAIVAVVVGVLAAITLTNSWIPILRIAGFGITESVRVPNSQCEEVRARMDSSKYTVFCRPGTPDSEFVDDLLRLCAEGFSGEFQILAYDNRLHTESMCETDQDRKDAAKAHKRGISEEDAEAFIAIYKAEPDGPTQ